MARYFAAPLIVSLFPGLVFADILPQFAGLFNIFVGLMLVAAFLFMGAGFILWLVRLGTYPTYRTEGIKLMMWAVTILFVLVVILGLVSFVQEHTAAASFIVGLIVFGLVAWFLIAVAASSKKEEEKKEH